MTDAALPPGHTDHGGARRIAVRQRVRIPLRGVPEPVEFVSFTGLAAGDEPVALLFGGIDLHTPVRVRVHSECLTGDVFHSLKCDCGPQLQEAMEQLSASGGALLYLRQEGRGIGLYAKLDACRLQSQGLDTFEANRRLGFADDLRTYGDAAAMLRALNITTVELLSNNPDKAHQLQAHGLQVTAVQPTAAHVNVHNRHYLTVKRQQHRHALNLDITVAQVDRLNAFSNPSAKGQ